jgi:GT2 family glycosyltransferase
MELQQIRVGVVLVHWNAPIEITHACIASINRNSLPPVAIVVIDNGSVKHDAATLVASFPNVQYIRNKSNIGFTGGNNIGIRNLLSQNVDFILVLNNDTVLDDDCISALVQSQRLERSVAITTGKTYYFDEPSRIWNAGSSWNETWLKAKHFGANAIDIGQFEMSREIPFADGCCMLIRANVLHESGVFDENFFAYNEDIDLCFRIRKLGFTVRYVPEAKLWHRVSASTTVNWVPERGSTSALQQFLSTRNRIFIIRRYARNRVHLISILAVTLMKSCFFQVVALILLRRIKKARAILLACAAGLATDLTLPSTHPRVVSEFFIS